MHANTKQAEKDYLRKSGGGAWEASKPFPPPGQVAAEDHVQHFQDFAVVLKVLAPHASDLVLDLGSGSCWVTDWLRRCGVPTVAVDISLDMIRLGSKRLGGTGVTVGDVEELPFRDGAFSKVCCLNAFHHVSGVQRALSEIRRVLSAEGVVFFSEPGVGHSSNPVSVAAVRNYGVLEQEILLEEFMSACRVAGFADVRVHPISHVMPLYVLTADEWRQWCVYTRSKRPTRALHKMWRAALELAGLGKKDVLFEEALAIRLARELQPLIEQHPIVTAHKVPFVAPPRVLDAARLRLVDGPAKVHAGDDLRFKLQIVNAGTTEWTRSPDQAHVRLGVQLLQRDGSVIDRDYGRQELPGRMSPGDDCEAVIVVKAPGAKGEYLLRFDLVREGVSWFELRGSPPADHELEVM
jgi:SAM-dependent methyltransferase